MCLKIIWEVCGQFFEFRKSTNTQYKQEYFESITLGIWQEFFFLVVWLKDNFGIFLVDYFLIFIGLEFTLIFSRNKFHRLQKFLLISTFGSY